MENYIRLVKPTCIIRGDRSSERVKGPERIEGVESVFPLWDWTTEQVMETIKKAPFGLFQDRHQLPEGSSLDCMTCMAYNVEHESRMKYLKEHHPVIYEGAVEFFREPDSFLGLQALGLSQGQWLSLPMIVLGGCVWLWAARKR